MYYVLCTCTSYYVHVHNRTCTSYIVHIDYRSTRELVCDTCTCICTYIHTYIVYRCPTLYYVHVHEYYASCLYAAYTGTYTLEYTYIIVRENYLRYLYVHNAHHTPYIVELRCTMYKVHSTSYIVPVRCVHGDVHSIYTHIANARYYEVHRTIYEYDVPHVRCECILCTKI